MYTDGVTEAMNQKNELYSEERLEALFSQHQKDNSSAQLINTIQKSIQDFTKGADQSDDICMVSLKWEPKS